MHDYLSLNLVMPLNDGDGCMLANVWYVVLDL